MPRWSVYMVRCKDGTLYTGIATEVWRRFADHQSGTGRCAKYLRGRGPLQLVFHKSIGRREIALRMEARIKRLPRALKEELIRGGRPIDRMLREVSRSAG